MSNKMKLALVGAAFSLSAGAATAECGAVSITEMNWASGAVVTSISKFLMEQGYGCTVTVVPSSTVPAVASVAETGEPDILTELWRSAVPAYTDLETAGKIKTLTHVLSDGGVEGWYVPAYLVAEHPEVATMDGILAHPELVGGIFNNAPDGWGARVKDDNLIKVWDFAGHGLEVFNHGSGETLAASLAAAYEAKAPWLGYYWEPTSLLGKYPMVMVDIGPYDPEAIDCVSKVDCADPKKTAFAPAEVVTGVTPTFAAREPAIEALMAHVSFTNAQMGAVLAWQEENKASADETAVHFLTEYKDVWSTWIDDSAREKLSALLK